MVKVGCDLVSTGWMVCFNAMLWQVQYYHGMIFGGEVCSLFFLEMD